MMDGEIELLCRNTYGIHIHNYARMSDVFVIEQTLIIYRDTDLID